MKNYLICKFKFSSEWDGLTKTALFFPATGGDPYKMLLTEDACPIPWEVIEAPTFGISVFAGDRMTASLYPMTVKQSGYAEGQESIEPTPDVYAQMLAAFDAAKAETAAGAATATTKAGESAQSALSASQDKTTVEGYKDQTAADLAAVGQLKTDVIGLKDQTAESATQAGEYANQALNNMLNGINTHNSDNAAHASIQQDIRQVEAIARGRATAYVFDTYADMLAWLAVPENAAALVVGDNLYIRDTAVKDYWWDGAEPQELEAEAPDLTNYYTKAQVDGTMPITITRAAYDALVAAGTVEAGRTYYITEGA